MSISKTMSSPYNRCIQNSAECGLDVLRQIALSMFHPHSDPWFKAVEDGHEIIAIDLKPQGVERLFVRDDWFVHAHAAFAIRQLSGEGRVGMHEFNEDVKRYLGELVAFFVKQEVEGPFAITLALQSVGESEHFGGWFPWTSVVRTLRPRIVGSLYEPTFIDDFLRKVRQSSIFG